MIVLDGASLTPADVVAVARDGEQVELSAAARDRNASARAAVAALLERGEPLYGASTGVGALRDREISDEEREQAQWNLLRSHAVSAGAPVPRAVVRAAMVIRANQLGAGGAGTAPGLLDALVAAINAEITPVTHEFGSLGTGDLPALAEIALALLGEGQVWSEGQLGDADRPAERLRLGLRDALGFMSSNALTAGHASLILADWRVLQASWLAVAALSFEALCADPVVLDERVQAARGLEGQAAVARTMRALLGGAERAERGPDRPVQDPYPFRVLPQVDGATFDACAELERVLELELNARGENALIEGGQGLPNGNFYAAALGAALDAGRAALAGSASLIAARVSALLDPRFTGLTPFLAHQPGLESGVMMLEYTAHSAAAEARSLAGAMAAQTVSASLGVESHATLATTGARHMDRVLEAMRVLVATELVVAMRALALAGREPTGAGTRKLFEAAQAALPRGLEDRQFGRDVALAGEVLASLPFHLQE
jgi:histidine ammonia-lyase